MLKRNAAALSAMVEDAGPKYAGMLLRAYIWYLEVATRLKFKYTSVGGSTIRQGGSPLRSHGCDENAEGWDCRLLCYHCKGSLLLSQLLRKRCLLKKVTLIASRPSHVSQDFGSHMLISSGKDLGELASVTLFWL